MINYSIQLLILLLFLSNPVFANTPDFDLKHLQELFNSYKRSQSYDYALKYKAEMEGDPYFDYIFGVSAIDTGRASEGTFALERVLLIAPDDQVARLELARGYFILQEYALSRITFEDVLETNPPAQVRSTAEAYLDNIRVSESRYRPTHDGFLAFTLGNDSNVNAGVDENTIVPFGFELTQDSLTQDDNFATLTGAWGYAHPVSPGWILESNLSGDFRKNQDLDQFDTATATLQLGITHLQAASKYRAEVITQQFNLDGDKYRSLNGVNFSWQYTLSELSSFNASLQYAQLDYPDPLVELRNSDLITLNLGYTKTFSAYLQPLFFSAFSIATEKAEDDNNIASLSETERDIYSLRLGVILNFTNTLALQTGIGTQNSTYAAGSSGLAGDEREDDYNTADLNLIWAFTRKWRLETRFAHTKNSSSEDLKNYDRNVASLTANYTF